MLQENGEALLQENLAFLLLEGEDMAEATNIQVQQFCDLRIRRFAERFRGIITDARDHKSAIDDVYARAAGVNAWADARTDGPPHLLKCGNSSNPDDVLNFNSFVSALTDIIDGVGTDATNAANLRANWAVLVDACVQPANVYPVP
jgi:hypothetical protein